MKPFTDNETRSGGLAKAAGSNFSQQQSIRNNDGSSKTTTSSQTQCFTSENWNLYVQLSQYVLYSTLAPAKLHTIKLSNSHEEEIANTLLKLVKQMILSNQNHFVEMVKKLNLKESNIGQVFEGVAQEVLKGDDKGTTWSRIAMLYAFSTTMAKECMSQSSGTFLETFSQTVGKFIEHQTSSWVASQGGWSSFVKEPTRPMSEYIFNAFGIGTTLLTAFVTVFGFGQSSSAFTSFMKS